MDQNSAEPTPPAQASKKKILLPVVIASLTALLLLTFLIPPVRRVLLDEFSYHIIDGSRPLADTRYFFEKGVAYSEEKRLALALRTFRRSVRKIDPQDPYQKESLYNIGVLYYVLGQSAQATGREKRMEFLFAEAKKVWTVYLQLYPEPSPRIDDITAAKAYVDSLDEEPTDLQAKTYKNLGQQEYYKKNYDQALVYYLKAVELDPTYDTAYNNIGSMYYFKKDYAKAVQYWERAVLLNPRENRDLYLNIGAVYLQFLDNPSRAVYFLKEHLKLNPKEPQKPQIEAQIRALESGAAAP